MSAWFADVAHSVPGENTVSATIAENSLPLLCKQFKRLDMVHITIVTKIIQILSLCCLVAGSYDPAYDDIYDRNDTIPYEICSSTNHHAADGPFQNNLESLFKALSSDASKTKSSNSSAGNDSERVYGLYMCLDYKSIDDCNKCVVDASEDISKNCPNKTEAIVWSYNCMLRYSSENFFSRLNVSQNIRKANTDNVSEDVSDKYRSILNSTLSDLRKEAAFDSANNMYVASGTAQFTDEETIYALEQCTGDLSAGDCNSCLQTATIDILSCCSISRGARLQGRSCYLRYESYDFINAGRATGKGSQRKLRVIVVVTVSVFLLVALLTSSIFYLAKEKAVRRRNFQSHNAGDLNTDSYHHQHIQYRDDLKAHEFYINLKTIHVATNNFSESNMLGRGGFGPVYKGKLEDGKEVAVKRLSNCSEQGTAEFTNEVLLIFKLQHKNLVKLLGYCVDEEEKLLVYEFMPNSSLDVILFDRKKCVQLNWTRRLNIINGIAKGMLYLHVDSLLKIIHRDLKASNVLLDADMNPKISDFGVARIFVGNEGEANTSTIVGTYFGVLLLEVITGRRNSGFHQVNHAPSLLAYAWQLWNEGNALELIDPLLTDACNPDEFLRYFHIGLLCVQEDAFDRPTMSSIVVMLKGETVTLRQPERPAFFMGRVPDHHEINNANDCSVNNLTVSDILPR